MQLAASLDKFHKTAPGHLVFGLAELVLAYGGALWAIDSGYIWLYLVVIILAFGGLANLVKMIGKLFTHE